VEALHRFARQRDAETLRLALGPGASEVARIVPFVKALLQVEPLPGESPEDDRLRLLDGRSSAFETSPNWSHTAVLPIPGSQTSSIGAPSPPTPARRRPSNAAARLAVRRTLRRPAAATPVPPTHDWMDQKWMLPDIVARALRIIGTCAGAVQLHRFVRSPRCDLCP
jgi:hypothetical protein